MIETIDDLRTFTRIIAAGNMSRAASSLGVTLNVISKRLASLEDRTGVRLINRTTRRLAPTDQGREFYLHALKILDAIDEAESSLRGTRAEPKGLLRISAPSALARYFVSAICSKMHLSYEDLNIDLIVADRLVDIAEEHVDVAFRIGETRDQTAIVRKLAEDHAVVLAAPTYIEKFGAPLVPADLIKHSCLSSSYLNISWRLENANGETREIKLLSRLRCLDDAVVLYWAVEGLGLIFRSTLEIAEELRTGRLVRVLPEWGSEPSPICATYLPDRLKAMKVVSLLDLAERSLRGSI